MQVDQHSKLHALHDQRFKGVEGAVLRHEEQIQGLTGNMHSLGLRTDDLEKRQGQGQGSSSPPRPGLWSGYSGVSIAAPGPVSSGVLGPSSGHSTSPATVLPSACFERPLAAGPAAARSRSPAAMPKRVAGTGHAIGVDADIASLLQQLAAPTAPPSLPIFERLRRGEHPAPTREDRDSTVAATSATLASSRGASSSQARATSSPAVPAASRAGAAAQSAAQAALATTSTAESGAAHAAAAAAAAAGAAEGLVVLADAGKLKQQVLSSCLSSTEGRDKRAIACRLQAMLPPEHKVDAVNLNKMVNRLLYRLEKEGKARSVQEDPRAPPLWTKV